MDGPKTSIVQVKAMMSLVDNQGNRKTLVALERVH